MGKKEDYAAFGIREYVQFDPLDPSDPEAPLLVPALQVWRLVDGRYEAAEVDPGGGVPSVVSAGLDWVQVGGSLRLRDGATGALCCPPPRRSRPCAPILRPAAPRPSPCAPRPRR